MLEQYTPFRLCSSQPSLRSSNLLYQRRCKFTPRNNPQPTRVRHFNGLQNMPICYVRESSKNKSISQHEEHPALARSNTFSGLPMLQYRNIPYKEKAIPRLGLFPIQEPWRRELHALTECIVAPVLEDLGKSEDISKIIECHPYPICRPITSWRTSQIMNFQNKNVILPVREKLKTPKFTQISLVPNENFQFMDNIADDFEGQVFALLGQVLQCRDIEAVKFWLATANDREKASVMSILQTAIESKMKGDLNNDEHKENDQKKRIEEDQSSTIPAEEEDDEHSEEVDRLLIHTRQSTRTDLYRPKTQASKIRPLTANSFVSIENGSLDKKPQTAPVYLRYKTSLNTKCVQTDDSFGEDSIKELSEADFEE